jgi:cytochrome b pre-mRNA-processing protein 6
MSQKIAYKHYLRALSRWPKDPLRPGCQFQDAMRRRIDKRYLPAAPSDTPGAAQAVANSPIDEKVDLDQVNAIYSLLENRYSRKVHFAIGFRVEGMMD